MKSNKLLKEMFISERVPTHPRHAETELNMGTSVSKQGRPGHRWSASTGKMQSDVDSAQSLVKKEQGEPTTGLRITGDAGTLEILGQAIELLAKHGADDDAEWADEALNALRGAKDGNVTLPPFKATPGLDSFNDDSGAGPEDEDY